jgi:LmbE family N-acetylglucosaminyl deacetylase
MSKTVLVLSPHPDDAEYFAGGTLAKLAREGARVVMVVVTDGRSGSFGVDSETLRELRAAEARQGAAALGAEPPVFLGYADYTLDTLPAGRLREQFIRLIRQYRPDVVVVEDAMALGEVHPDHRAVAWAASDALASSALPLIHPEHLAEGLQPHFVVEKYFYMEGGLGANMVVDISETLQQKLAALAEHKTQMQFMVEDVLKQAAAADLDVRAIVGVPSDDPAALVAWALQTQAAEVGRRFNVAYGEAFRYARFHPVVEMLLAAQE